MHDADGARNVKLLRANAPAAVRQRRLLAIIASVRQTRGDQTSFFPFPEFTINHRAVGAFERVSAKEFEDRR